jgi:hypothetical protein
MRVDPQIAAYSTMEVQLISATWCKRCQELKPSVIATCATIGATFRIVDYDELEEDDPLKESVKALPSLLFRRIAGGDWQMYGASAFETWKQDATAAAVATALVSDDF